MATLAQTIDQPHERVTAGRFPLRALLAVLAVALVGRVLLIASGALSFHSDEAVVALMARHILQGERPVFFYGQAYMGSLDAWLVAVGFAVFGQTVMAIRIVQSILYFLVVGTGFMAAWKLSKNTIVATVAALTLAIPTVMVAVYTSTTLGGYNETMIFGHLVIYLGYDLSHEHMRSRWRWALIGLIGGLAWWTNGLIAGYAAPVALLLLYRLFKPLSGAPPVRERWLLVGLAVVFFFVGSAPWWVFNFENDWAALAFYYVRTNEGRFAGNDVPSLPFDLRVFGLIFLGFPTLFGMRYPWTNQYFAPQVGVFVLFVFLFGFYRIARGSKTASGEAPLRTDARGFILLMTLLYIVIFVASKFSIDPTGRYFLPMTFTFGIALGVLAATIKRVTWMGAALVAFVLGYFAVGQVGAASVEPGITTQFNLESYIPNDYDEELIAFLDEHELYSGYTTYWVSFRLAFLTNERMQYSSALPYKTNLQYTLADERIPEYKATADDNPHPAYIIAKVEAVHERFREILAERGITYDEQVIGPYTIYYNFEPEAPRPPLPFNDGTS